MSPAWCRAKFVEPARQGGTCGVHSSKDQLSQIKEDDYYNTYKFLSAYLAYLDNAVLAHQLH